MLIVSLCGDLNMMTFEEAKANGLNIVTYATRLSFRSRRLEYRYATWSELKGVLRCHRDTVAEAARRGKIYAQRTARGWRYELNSLATFLLHYRYSGKPLRAGKWWSREDDMILLNYPLKQAAEILNRTYSACRTRKSRLKKK